MLEADGPSSGKESLLSYQVTSLDFNRTKQNHQQLVLCVLQLRQREI